MRDHWLCWGLIAGTLRRGAGRGAPLVIARGSGQANPSWLQRQSDRARPHGNLMHKSSRLASTSLRLQNVTKDFSPPVVRYASSGSLRSSPSRLPKPAVLASAYLPMTNPSSVGEPSLSMDLVAHVFNSHQNATAEVVRRLKDAALGRSDIEPLANANSGTVGDELRKREPSEVLGLPKIFWALVVDLVAMALFIACIPLILTVAKRRPSPNLCNG